MGFAAAAALTFCTPATGAAAEPAAVVDAFLAAYNLHDLDGMRRQMTRDAVITQYPDMKLMKGSQLIDRYEKNTYPAMPGVRIEVLQRMTSYDVVADLERVTWDRQTEASDGIAIYQVRGGCIVRMDNVLEPRS